MIDANHCHVITQLGSSLSSSSALSALCSLFPDFPPPFGLGFTPGALGCLCRAVHILLSSSMCHRSARPPSSSFPPRHVYAREHCDISAFPVCMLLFPMFYFCAHCGSYCTLLFFFFPIGLNVLNRKLFPHHPGAHSPWH